MSSPNLGSIQDKDLGSTFMKEMVRKMKLKFDKYWGSCNLLISIAAVLDPRNKMKYIEWCATNVYSDVEGVELKVTVRETLRSLYAEYVEAYKASTNYVRNVSDAQTESSNNVCNIKSKEGRSQSNYESYMQTVESVDEVKSDLDLYFEEGVVIWKEPTPFDVILWRKTHNLKFRILSRLACDVLSIPITTVASELAFSAGGRVIDPHRASLGVDTVQMLLCAGDWLRARYDIKGKAKDNKSIKEITLT